MASSFAALRNSIMNQQPMTVDISSALAAINNSGRMASELLSDVGREERPVQPRTQTPQTQPTPETISSALSSIPASPTTTPQQPVINSGSTGSALEIQARNYFIDQGYSPAQAAGIVGNLIQESGLRTTPVGDNGTAFGVAQWRGDRYTGLQNFARERGLNFNDLNTQLAYVNHELNTTESRAGNLLRNAQNVRDATAAMISYERPQGWSWDNPVAGHGWNNRLSHATRLAGL